VRARYRQRAVWTLEPTGWCGDGCNTNISVHVILTSLPDKYNLYELITRPKGEKIYRDPYATLRRTQKLVTANPSAASAVKRLWFDGLHAPETDAMILSTIHSCQNLQSVSIPWTVLRHGTADDWAALLATDREQPLRSLELLAVTLSEKQAEAAAAIDDLKPLQSPKVSFSKLKRLKLLGDTTFMPVSDTDLKVMSKTATSLEEFQITCMSTISIEGVMAIVRSSRRTLRVLEHSPRSMDGFWHPHPGHYSSNVHLCDVLSHCPNLEDLSISIPSMCSTLFNNHAVKWRGDCQVRALHICKHDDVLRSRSRSHNVTSELRKLLAAARSLTRAKAASYIPTELTLELFFADCIFDPHVEAVHGDFALAEVAANGSWPLRKALSRKGPYGSTGLYGKDEETPFDRVPEDEYLRGLEAGYVVI
jgi:hypothetical protein